MIIETLYVFFINKGTNGKAILVTQPCKPALDWQEKVRRFGVLTQDCDGAIRTIVVASSKVLQSFLFGLKYGEQIRET